MAEQELAFKSQVRASRNIAVSEAPNVESGAISDGTYGCGADVGAALGIPNGTRGVLTVTRLATGDLPQIQTYLQLRGVSWERFARSRLVGSSWVGWNQL